MKLYLMRHGKTDWNAELKCQGRTDIPLNDEGREMAREAAEQCRKLKIDRCYSSPLKRAYETATIVTEGLGIEVIPDDRLMEISLGAYEGSDHVLDKPDHPLYPFFMSPGTYVPLEGTESFEDVAARGIDFLENEIMPNKDKYDGVLVVAHAVILRCIMNYMLDIPKDRFWELHTKNCGLMEFDI